MKIIIGSARHDEHGSCYSGGKAGDQLQNSTKNDMIGEVSMQRMYKHIKGWYVLRPKSVTHADAIASRVEAACNNLNIGYDQNERLGIVKYGIDTKVKTECDCSSLIREAIKEATFVDPGNFTTANEISILEATGLFEKKFEYVSETITPLYEGDILVTKVKGHTAAVVSGNKRSSKHKVTGCNHLNIREDAGTDYKILCTVPVGTVVNIVGSDEDKNGFKWYHVKLTYKGTQYTGFCSSKYIS